MSLSSGHSYLAIPGPSAVPDRVLNAMHRASPNIYAGPLIDMVDTLYPDLKSVARTTGDVAIYMGNGHAAWEASLSNLFSRGDKILVLATGAFGLGWAEAAQGLGINAEVMDFGKRDTISMARVHDRLSADTAREIKAVLAVHVDTATSVRNDIRGLRACINASGHPALLMVDCIASLACDRFEMDAWGVDVAIVASQKGLMMPPGLCFVYFNKKADEVHKYAGLVSPYWNWTPRTRAPELFRKFCGTAPTAHLLGLRESLDMIVHEQGMASVWARHETLATAVWAALDCWGTTGSIAMNIADPAWRSCAVTTVAINPPLGTRLRVWVEEHTGVTLGISLGMALADDPAWHGFFRIAHMGHVNAHMTLGALACIDAGLKALDIDHGQGAVEAATKAIAAAVNAANS